MNSNAINHFRKIDNKQFQFSLTEDNGKKRKINIYIIDPKNGVTLFEYPEKKKEYRYELRVAVNKIRNFPIIVNYCEVQKQDELEFDKPDYQRLINSLLTKKQYTIVDNGHRQTMPNFFSQ